MLLGGGVWDSVGPEGPVGVSIRGKVHVLFVCVEKAKREEAKEQQWMTTSTSHCVCLAEAKKRRHLPSDDSWPDSLSEGPRPLLCASHHYSHFNLSYVHTERYVI